VYSRLERGVRVPLKERDNWMIIREGEYVQEEVEIES